MKKDSRYIYAVFMENREEKCENSVNENLNFWEDC